LSLSIDIFCPSSFCRQFATQVISTAAPRPLYRALEGAPNALQKGCGPGFENCVSEADGDEPPIERVKRGCWKLACQKLSCRRRWATLGVSTTAGGPRREVDKIVCAKL